MNAKFDGPRAEALWEMAGHPRREFAFEYANGAMKRYQSFASAAEFTAACAAHKPAAVHVGAVYAGRPAAKGAANVVEYKELVFDLDLTDYDDVRSCGCTLKKMCAQCWPIAEASVRELDRMLRTWAGFKDVRWFFSGGRGVHGWVMDPGPRVWTDAEREQFVAGLGAAFDRFMHTQQDAVALARALVRKCAAPPPRAQEGGVLGSKRPEAWAVLARAASGGSAKVEASLSVMLHSSLVQTPEARWGALEACVSASCQNPESKRDALAPLCRALLKPRLDVAVTTKRAHLIKVPLGRHAKSGKLCRELRLCLPEFPRYEQLL